MVWRRCSCCSPPVHQRATYSEAQRAQALRLLVAVSLPLQTFEEADIAKDGRISKEEWIILCKNQPAIISFMTLPLLKNDLTKKYPSFIFNV